MKVILYPNGAGSLTQLHYATGANHWEELAAQSYLRYAGSNPIDHAPGDANLDGSVDVLDPTWIQWQILHPEDITIESDVNQSGTVSIADVTVCENILLTIYDFATTAKKDIYTLSDLGMSSSITINSVTLHYSVKSGPSNGGKVKPEITLGTDTTELTEVTGTTSWVDKSEVLNNPDGGDWTVDDLNNLLLAFTVTRDYGANIILSKVYLEIDILVSTSRIRVSIGKKSRLKVTLGSKARLSVNLKGGGNG